jgi:hypothetical protein
MFPGYDYDFEMTIRSDEQFSRSVRRELVESFIGKLPGVIINGDKGFALNSSFGCWMDIMVESRRWDGKVGERVDGGELANCVHLRIPQSARGPEKEREYFMLAFAIANHLGWNVHDDTDSGDWVSKEGLEVMFPTGEKPKPWWKIW